MTLPDMWRWGMPEFSGGGEVALLMMLVGLGIIWVIIWVENWQRRRNPAIG
jgi:hypothetical protein